MNHIQDIIEQKEDNSDMNQKIVKFKDYVYLCHTQYKEIKFFVLDTEVVYLLSPYNKNIEEKIPLSSIRNILIPNSSTFLLELEYE